MKIPAFSIFLLLSCLITKGQIIVKGHNYLNGEKLKNVQIVVKDVNNNTIQSLNTKNNEDFTLKMNFGKNYRVYFQNRQSPVMFMEVLGGNVPEDKQSYTMTHELDVLFFLKNDGDVDTTVFNKPFQKILFDGKNKMVNDTAYSNAFDRKIIKDSGPLSFQEPVKTENLATICGRALLAKNKKHPLVNKTITLINQKGEQIKTSKTNRFGAFSFTGVKPSELAKIKIETEESDAKAGFAEILNSEGEFVFASTCNLCENSLSSEQVKKLIDNNYTYNIGGKLLVKSAKQKKFYAGKSVYLANKRNTILKKTKTSALGTFVFENLKPDNTYFIEVDNSEVAPDEKIDFLNKEDKFISHVDSLAGGKRSIKVNTDYNSRFNDISVSNEEMKMKVNAKIFGDNTNNPIGKLKVVLLNDAYQPIDSALTDDLGAIRFKFIPFLKQFYLSAENTNNVLDGFNNILVYSGDDNLIKIMTHTKGEKFKYKPMMAETGRLTELDIDDPWLDLLTGDAQKNKTSNKTIIENILFEFNKYELLPEAVPTLDKVILVLNANQKIKLELSAHTDSKGNDADNLKLSQMRANAVKEYIIGSGVDNSRLIATGYGESKLINKCKNDANCSELEHAQNRRVEFKILGE